MQKAIKILPIVAIISLLLAYASGQMTRGKGELALLQEVLPGKQIVRVSQNKALYELSDAHSGEQQGTIIVESAQGWGGPFKLAMVIDTQGKLKDLHVLSHKETPSFFQHLQINGFFEQFSGKPIGNRFSPRQEIDLVSSATVSSEAFTKAARNGAHWVGKNRFGMQIEKVKETWKFGTKEMLLLGLYSLVLAAMLMKFQKARLYLLAFSVVFLGFYVNRPISISNIGAVALGFVPSVYEQLFWWLLVVGVLLLTVLVGKNFYCFWMCPFGGLQEFVSRIGGVKLKLSQGLERLMRWMVYALLWAALMIIFLTSNPAMGNFEPFAVLFSLKGLGIQWYLVTLAMLGSFFIPRFWCRYFCPVGVVLQNLAKLKGKMNHGFATLMTLRRG